MKKIELDKELLQQNPKRQSWHLPPRPPFTITDTETGEVTQAHSVLLDDGYPVLIDYNFLTHSFTVVTHGSAISYNYGRKERKELE